MSISSGRGRGKHQTWFTHQAQNRGSPIIRTKQGRCVGTDTEHRKNSQRPRVLHEWVVTRAYKKELPLFLSCWETPGTAPTSTKPRAHSHPLPNCETVGAMEVHRDAHEIWWSLGYSPKERESHVANFSGASGVTLKHSPF